MLLSQLQSHNAENFYEVVCLFGIGIKISGLHPFALSLNKLSNKLSIKYNLKFLFPKPYFYLERILFSSLNDVACQLATFQ